MSGGGLEWDSQIEQVADALCRHGFRLPALIGLEAGRPLAFVGGQLLWLAQPALGLVIPRQLIGDMAHLLESPRAVETLISKLEARET